MISLLRRSVLFFTVLSFVQVLIFLPVHAQIYSNGFEGGGIPGTTSFTGGATGDPNLNIATSNWSTSGVFTTFTGNAPTATTSMALQPATALTTNWTLTVPVNAGYSANITGIKLDYRSTGTSYTGLSITVNGTSVYVNNTLNTTSTWVTVPITGLTLTGITGNISVVCVLSGGTHGGASTFRFDNFSITGNVIPTNNPPVFTGSVIQALSVCQNSSATSINSLMSINDLDVGQTETWTINSGPTNGSLIGFSASGTSTGGTITPVGLTYTPSPGFSGSDAFSIKISDGIASATTTVNVTVTPIPVPTTIAGVQNVCAGANTPLSNIVSGGVWSSATTTVATIGPSGIVYGITAGNSAISYTVTNGCGVAVSTTTVTVDPLPIAGIISGTSSVCVGAITSLSSTASGGIWSSATTSIATVSNIGDVTGVNAGNSIISYSVTNGCGTDVTTATVTVRPLAVAGTITGVTVFCLRAMTSISDAITGGVWSSGNTNIATVSGSGGVTGVNAGISVISYSVTNGCGTTNATTTINVLPLPSVFPLGGGGNYCSGGIGMHIMLNSSEPGINYQLYYGSAATGSVVAGTGGIIDFGLQTAAGTYTVSGTNSTTGCVNNMSGSSTISIDLLPGVFAVTGGGPICSGVPVHVGLTGSELGVNYQLYNGPSAYGAVVAGTGSLLDLGLVTTAGTYTVMAINSTTTCINGMSGSTTITVTPSVIPSVNIISGMGDTVCSGISNTFFPLSLNEGTAPVYKWSVNGIYAGVGGTYSYIPANGDVVSVVLTSNAVCAVPDTAVGAITIAVQTSQMPYVNANVTPGNIVCQGQRVTLTAAPVYGGTSPSYLWVVNGSVVVSGPSYYYAPANGDDVYCTMKSNFRCLTIDSVLSGIVHLTVDSMILPLVTISSDPGALITIGESVTLKAIVTNAVGTSLSYLWLLNGVSTGNNTNQFISTTLGYPSPDSLTCLVTCTGGVCGPLTGFNWIYISAFPVEVNQFASNERNITVVPNPSKGDIMINGSFGTPLAAKDELSIELVNTIGQVIYTHKASAYFGNIGEHLLLSNEIVNGTYMLNVQSSTMSKTFHIVIQR